MQRVTLAVGNSFGTVETNLKDNFVPEVFEGLREGVPEQGVTRLPIKQEGLALTEPFHTAPENCPGLTSMLTTTSEKSQGLADSEAVHSQWGVAGGTGMVLRPIPAVWPQAPEPPNTL